jgi:cell division protein FtsI (penicillin-binding protein 3)/stage V sporulation protein D (sporulation-specific penicillin-binding protein)
MRYNFASRIRILSFIVIVCAIVLIVRLYFLQVVYSDSFKIRADHQYSSPSQSVFDRGSIFFVDKNGTRTSAATIKSGFFLTINPKLIAASSSEEIYKKLSTIAVIDHATFIQKATKPNDAYEEIVHRLSADQATAITALNIPGVNLYKEQWRFYPGETAAAQTVGFVGWKGDDLVGRYGLESSDENILQRTNQNVSINSFAQMFSDLGTAVTSGVGEGDVVTTIEPTVQSFLDEQLVKTNKKWSSTMTGGIIIDPKTGEIYALGSYPTFDPNTYQTQKDISVFSNPLVENVYEMGSIVKALTMAAGLDAGVVTAASTYNDTGSKILNGKKISNYDGRARGVIPMQEVLNQSLNLGAAYVESKLGNTLFTKYMLDYGLGSKSGIDLPNEGRSLVNNLNSPRDIEHATASYGQGIAVSPMAITRALSVLANGGTLITPHVTKEIDYQTGLTKVTPIVEGERVIQESTSKEITRMLVSVVDHALLEGAVKQTNYTIAAKTGTAQIADPTGGYYSDRYLHSFFGYFPAYNPRFLVFLYTVYPKGVDYASHTLTQPFIDVVKDLINYYQIPPDR